MSCGWEGKNETIYHFYGINNVNKHCHYYYNSTELELGWACSLL